MRVKNLALAGLLALVAWSWWRYQIDPSPYGYDEADYMFAASRGFLANWSDSPSLSLPEFVHIGLSRGADASQRGDLSVMLRDSGDMDGYRHWHGPLYYYGLALAPADAGEHTVRVLSLAAPLLGLAVIYLGCLWLWPASASGSSWGTLAARGRRGRIAKAWDSHHISPQRRIDSMRLPGGRNTVAVPVFAPDDFHHGLLAAVLASLLFLWSPAVIKTTELAPHILFAAVCLAALFATAKFRETGRRSHWYAALALCGVAFCTMEVAFALVATVLICGHLERDRLLGADGWGAFVQLAGRSLAAFVAPVLLLWPAGLYKLNFIKSYLFMAYLAVFRKGAWGDVTFAQTWASRFKAMPVEWAALALALILFFCGRFFRWRDLPGRRQMSVFLIFGAIMLAVVFRVNSTGIRYVLPFFPALMVFTGCVLASAMSGWKAPVRWTLAMLLAALVFVDTARQVNGHAPEISRQSLALLDAIRDPRWQGKTLLVPQDDVPTLHFYFQDIQFRGYTDASAIPARLSAQHFDGVVYPNDAGVRVPVLSSR